MVAERILRESRILIVDDNPANVMVVERMLDWSGYTNVRSASNADQALLLFETFQPDLMILDLHMPNISGFEVLAQLRQLSGGQFLPILVFTADTTGTAKKKALELGASDFLTKPGDATEIALRVQNFLETRHLTREIEEKNAELEAKVAERTKALWTSQVEIVDRLARVANLGQEEEQDYGLKVAELCAAIAAEMGWSRAQSELLRLAAPLHDIGRLTTREAVLAQGAAASTEDTEREHTVLGARVLEGGRTPLLSMAEAMARSHHELWDGTGYPDRLAGKNIPEAARILAVAEAFAAAGRQALPEAAAASVAAGAGSQFDPDVVVALLRTLAAAKSEAA